MNINIPRIIKKAPITGLKYFKYLSIFFSNPVALEKKAAVIKKGVPSPKEYANSKLYASPGEVAAKVNVLPKIGPTHGVHPAAKAIPNTNEVI
ncbi:MAG: hypothetical protein K0S93_778 [Nitrososphaeraceae archaeon]|nr:hypothetical protein [Nitrososphaeraceae archaeon]